VGDDYGQDDRIDNHLAEMKPHSEDPLQQETLPHAQLIERVIGHLKITRVIAT
jgi:hypothetical protein